MPDSIKWTVRPGGLSAEDHQTIRDLAERGWSHSRIARRLEKHPSTVGWFMVSRGLKECRAKTTERKPFYRGDGVLVSPFTPDQDAFIEALRTQNYTVTEIARIANERFGTRRAPNTILQRLVMLAGREHA